MHTGFFNMLHNTADNRGAAVADGIYIEFKCVFDKFIDQYRMIR